MVDHIDYEKAVVCDYHIFSRVWPEVEKMRNSEELLKLRESIRCPLTAIHGEYDPHPIESIKKAFNGFVSRFAFFPLKKCGHCPWLERYAKDDFYKIILREIGHDQ